jgi:hypothetical protein
MSFKARRMANLTEQERMNRLLEIISHEQEFRELANRFQHKRKNQKSSYGKDSNPMVDTTPKTPEELVRMTPAQLENRWTAMLGPDEPEEAVNRDPSRPKHLTAFDRTYPDQMPQFYDAEFAEQQRKLEKRIEDIATSRYQLEFLSRNKRQPIKARE